MFFSEKDISVCMKGMVYLSDESLAILEWLLLLKEQEFGKVYFYIIFVHANIWKLLKQVFWGNYLKTTLFQ